MLLTLTLTTPPATDLGYLLHKNPSTVQAFELPFGTAHVAYPTATDTTCTAALILDIDPVQLVRGARSTVDQYVNDRPYVASSFMSVALAKVYASALAGQSKERQALADRPLAFTAQLAVVRSRGGEPILRRLFEPLGYTVVTEQHPLDPQYPEWGGSNYFTLTLSATCRLCDLLTHLYVLLPVLDAEKHYWMGDEEVAKLLRRGEGWLTEHPERTLITQRYLKHPRLIKSALAQLIPDDPLEAEPGDVEQQPTLHDQRLGAVLAVLKQSGARRVLDLGCGEGRLLQLLLNDASFNEIVGMDVAHRSLEIAADRLRLDRLPPLQQQRIQLIHGSLMYRDHRLEGYDAAAVVEVIEHLDEPRLAAFERVVFEYARPTTVVCTTPNAEYNIKYPNLTAGAFRHTDHRFEWTRATFQAWATALAARFGYTVHFLPVGPEDSAVGAPTQMGVFTR